MMSTLQMNVVIISKEAEHKSFRNSFHDTKQRKKKKKDDGKKKILVIVSKSL